MFEREQKTTTIIIAALTMAMQSAFGRAINNHPKEMREAMHDGRARLDGTMDANKYYCIARYQALLVEQKGAHGAAFTRFENVLQRLKDRGLVAEMFF